MVKKLAKKGPVQTIAIQPPVTRDLPEIRRQLEQLFDVNVAAVVERTTEERKEEKEALIERILALRLARLGRVVRVYTELNAAYDELAKMTKEKPELDWNALKTNGEVEYEHHMYPTTTVGAYTVIRDYGVRPHVKFGEMGMAIRSHKEVLSISGFRLLCRVHLEHDFDTLGHHRVYNIDAAVKRVFEEDEKAKCAKLDRDELKKQTILKLKTTLQALEKMEKKYRFPFTFELVVHEDITVEDRNRKETVFDWAMTKFVDGEVPCKTESLTVHAGIFDFITVKSLIQAMFMFGITGKIDKIVPFIERLQGTEFMNQLMSGTDGANSTDLSVLMLSEKVEPSGS